ncbi:integrase/recombinase xerD homolog [Haliotis cracherodii]|uniref:integrase/recombinase xerD homolog n=1 Tax=Haliotis cracherodii TaxID=6455 RepID=UPI0039EAC471
MHFIAHLSLTGKSPRTAKSYISALTTWQKLHGMHDLTSHFLIQKGGRGVQIQITAILHSKLCPVRAMQQFLSIRPPVHGHVFVHFDGRPLTRFQFQSMLRKALSFSLPHLNLHLFSSHSFRIGAATTAAINGVSSKQIQEYGRWKSNCYSKYIRITQLTT